MTTVRFILAIVVLLLAVYIAAVNWGCVIVSARHRKRGIDRYHSRVPVLTFILAALAYPIDPHAHKMWIFAIPLLDTGNWMLLWLPVLLLRERKPKRISD